MDINCRKLNCKHNKKCVCMAKSVDIVGSTICKTYVEDVDKEVNDITKTMFVKTPKYENFRHIKKANIKCCAPCMFNKNGKCLANGIIVLTGTNKPLCGTFISATAPLSDESSTKRETSNSRKKPVSSGTKHAVSNDCESAVSNNAKPRGESSAKSSLRKPPSAQSSCLGTKNNAQAKKSSRVRVKKDREEVLSEK